MTERDLYPSRKGEVGKVIPRVDPVVWNKDKDIEPPLDESLIQKYEEEGFLILEDVFSREEVTSLQNELRRLREQDEVKRSKLTISEPGSGDVRSVFKIHQISDVFREVSQDDRLVSIASYLLADDLYIHQSRLNYKPGFRGKEFYWHSDFETWHVEDGMPKMRALSISITLSENYEHNGSLMLIPGSHKDYIVCEGETPENHFEDSLKKQEYGVPSDSQLKNLTDKSRILTAVSKPGSIIVFDSNTMHGSNGNITPYPRSNAFIVYNAVSNKVGSPFCSQKPRPEHICSREEIEIIPKNYMAAVH